MSSVALIPVKKIDELAASLPELESAMSYSLADAIREGSSVTGHNQNGWVNKDGDMCALSAAMLAVKARHLL